MSDPNRIRRQQILREAEGYLDLITVFGGRWPCRSDARDKLALRVLATLDRIDNPGGLRSHIQFLRGQALRTMERYGDAVKPLREAADLEPENFHIRLALGWCYKRVKRLDLAIQTLEEALEADAEQAILHYNLACYWSLAGNAKTACTYLAQAFDLQPDYRDLVGSERDFDPIRRHPYFQSLTSVIV
ncbi:tetratricopeptide repeat protein [Anatilimnocola sp. NA78]|uniref:TPR end-of-group domain-containing protein n=1 Tax=Anatilimnocola sp. NA78 TaxID=3415683 RepID=UPI003CE5847E